MVTIKDTQLGSNGGVFESILSRLQSKTSTSRSAFSNLSDSDDDALFSRVSGSNSNSASNGALGQINSRLQSLTKQESSLEAAKGLRDRADALAVELSNVAEGSERAGALLAESNAVSSELSRVGGQKGEVIRPENPGPKPPVDPEKPEVKLPETREELEALKKTTEEERAILREDLQANNKASDELGDKIDKKSKRLSKISDREERLNERLSELDPEADAKKIEKLNKSLERIGKRKDKLEGAVSELSEEKASIDAAGAELIGKVEEKSELIGKIDEKLKALDEAQPQDPTETLLRERTRNEQQLGDLEKQNKNLSSEIERSKESLAKIDEQLKAAKENPNLLSEKDREKLIGERDKINEGLKGLTSERDELTGAINANAKRSGEIDKEVASLQKQVLTDDQKKEAGAQLDKLKESIKPTTDRLTALDKTDQQIGSSLEKAQNRLDQAKERFAAATEAGADDKTLKALRKQVASSQQDVTGLERDRERIQSQAGKLRESIASTENEIKGIEEKLAASDEAEKTIAERGKEQAALSRDSEKVTKELGKVTERIAKESGGLTEITGALKKDEEGRKAISDLEARTKQENERIENNSQRISANQERSQALTERNKQIDEELKRLEESGQAGTPATPAEARNRLEDQVEANEKELAALEEERKKLEESSASLIEKRDSATVTIAESEKTLKGLRTDEELEKAASGLEKDAAKATDELEKFDKKNGTQLEIFQKLEDEFRAGANAARDLGLNKIADALDKVADAFGKQVKEIKDERAPIEEKLKAAQDGLKGIEDERQLRNDTEVALATAKSDVASANEGLEDNKVRSREIGAQVKDLSAENEDLQKVLAPVEGDGIDTAINPEDLTEGERRDLAKDAGKALLGNQKDLDKLSKQIEKLADKEEKIGEKISRSEERISTLTGKIESGKLSEEEGRKLIEEEEEKRDRLIADRQSIQDQQLVLGENRDIINNRGAELESFIGDLRDRGNTGGGTQPPSPQPDPDPDPGSDPGPATPRTSVERALDNVLGAVAGLDTLIDQTSAAIRTERASIQSELNKVGQEREIDIFAGRVPGVAGPDPAEDAARLADGIRNQILQLAKQGEGRNAISAAISDSTDVGKLTSRLSQLFT